MLRSSLVVLALALAPSAVFGIEFTDNGSWDVAPPCTTGNCRTTGNAGKAYHSLRLSGPSSALSDFTSAAGWKIDGCPQDWHQGSVTVKITCAGTRAQMDKCANLFEDGAEDTIVRLPKTCGQGSFARVVSTKDITKVNKFTRGLETHSVVLDYGFKNIKKNRGAVSFEVVTSNVDTAAAPAHGHSIAKRWDNAKTFDLPAIHINKTINLFDQSISCPANGGFAGFSASVKADVDVIVDTKIAFGFHMAGHIFPPQITKAEVYGAIDGSACAYLTVNAQASGSVNLAGIPVYMAPLPNLFIPGILSLGPKFGVYASLKADVAGASQIKTGVSWLFPKTNVTFPKSAGTSSANGGSHTKTPLYYSFDPSASGKSDITAGITPRFDVGLSFLSGLAEASLFADIETTANLKIQAEGHGHIAGKTTLTLQGGHKTTTAAPPTVTSKSAGGSGCASLGVGIDINVGAKGTLQPFFNKEAKWDVFSKKAEVFNKCFSAGTKKPKRSENEIASRDNEIVSRDLFHEPALGKRFAFVCPSLGLPGLLQMISTIA